MIIDDILGRPFEIMATDFPTLQQGHGDGTTAVVIERGGVPVVTLHTGTWEECEAFAKELIDELIMGEALNA